jgi:hypothetical protein
MRTQIPKFLVAMLRKKSCIFRQIQLSDTCTQTHGSGSLESELLPNCSRVVIPQIFHCRCNVKMQCSWSLPSSWILRFFDCVNLTEGLFGVQKFEECSCFAERILTLEWNSDLPKSRWRRADHDAGWLRGRFVEIWSCQTATSTEVMPNLILLNNSWQFLRCFLAIRG